MIVAPPLLAGAVKLTVPCWLPPMARTAVGAPGAPAVTAAEAPEAVLVPAEVVAVTVKV